MKMLPANSFTPLIGIEFKLSTLYVAVIALLAALLSYIYQAQTLPQGPEITNEEPDILFIDIM
jgi:hypothetical protein